MSQDQKHSQHDEEPDETPDLPGGDAAGQDRREKLGDDTDSILDEIDDVLEENAEDFVRAYIQKGGQ
jgi:prokaryotic ubiquitin-like protein Pup